MILYAYIIVSKYAVATYGLMSEVYVVSSEWMPKLRMHEHAVSNVDLEFNEVHACMVTRTT